ncbi:MAG TPA: dienelactone hydrolase [Noviherbaspirillum sp.]|nr:dienelactone hydrolase [Noviherbaspirillum sp.]
MKPAYRLLSLPRFILALVVAFSSQVALAAVGVTALPAPDGNGPVTVFYPTLEPAQNVTRGGAVLQLAPDAAPAPGNGRLVVISHGSGGHPWGHADLAQALVADGFIVAAPEHHRDNHRDWSDAGPKSWKRRPAEVSMAIDAVARDVRFATILSLDKVGVYGMSAGGHTALSLAGGQWSPARIRRHCEAHINEDFHACVGLTTQLRGNAFDGVRKAFALWVIGLMANDENHYAHEDGRVAAVVAGVPYAADFDMSTLAAPRVPLALVVARQDRWLVSRFHAERVLAACASCELLADLHNAGHGALLSPFPPRVSGLLADLLRDPPDFDRSVLPEVDRRISAFFRMHLVKPPGALAGTP